MWVLVLMLMLKVEGILVVEGVQAFHALRDLLHGVWVITVLFPSLP